MNGPRHINNAKRTMNQQRFHSIHDGLSAVAKKVYDAVPIQEAWSIVQIKQELERKQAGVTRDFRIFSGCINSLVNSGIVLEEPKGRFRRVKVTAKEAPNPASKPIALKALGTCPANEPIAAPVSAPVPVISTQKEEVMPAIKPNTATKAQPASNGAESTAEMTTIDRLSILSMRLKALAGEVVSLAGEIETAAIEIEEQNAVNAEGRKKLEQLQALLKSIT